MPGCYPARVDFISESRRQPLNQTRIHLSQQTKERTHSTESNKRTTGDGTHQFKPRSRDEEFSAGTSFFPFHSTQMERL
ncbi:UNVERIFIED_CONTAM: hypothetical protein NCL1_16061 [Trichonephila clavipes]